MLYWIGIVVGGVILLGCLLAWDLRYLVSLAAGLCIWTACLVFDAWLWEERRRWFR